MHRDRIAFIVMSTATVLAVSLLGPVASARAPLSPPSTQADRGERGARCDGDQEAGGIPWASPRPCVSRDVVRRGVPQA